MQFLLGRKCGPQQAFKIMQYPFYGCIYIIPQYANSPWIPIKEDNQNWKATKGDGKSIYDCENESWSIPKAEPLVRTYKKNNVKLDMDKHINSEWIEPNLRED